MPDSQKKNQKQKPEAKEQRKPRQGKRQQAENQSTGKKHDTTSPEIHCSKVKPVAEEPPPDFFKNLKRETDDIIKITEEASSKYKNKEILSNWAKYEMPIESYDDIEEQDMGADFEQLVQASMSVGGHFQFKHEKSWDQSTAPSLYDKYFDINSNNLSTALYTIPFYERNCIDKSMFTHTDIQNMEGRTSRHKQKYFNDKSFAPEADSLENIATALKEGLTFHDSINTENSDSEHSQPVSGDLVDEEKQIKFNTQSKVDKKQEPLSPLTSMLKSTERNLEDNIDDMIFGKVSPVSQVASVKCDVLNVEQTAKSENKSKDLEIKGQQIKSATDSKVMESPEDLEKWLDDFLDG